MTPTRVVLVEDHELVRAGLCTSLKQAGFDVAAEAADAFVGLETIEKLRPDIAVVDLGLPGKDGVTLTREIKAAAHPPRVVIVTMAEDEQGVLASLSAGADGYCVKTSGPNAIVDAVRTVAAGGAYFDAHVAHVVLRRFNAAQRDVRGTLKPRQLQILRLIAEGVPNPEIAERLHLSLGTVKGYVAEILVELSAADRTQAAVTAFRRGILS